MKRTVLVLILVSMGAWSAPTLMAFCGFYVGKADTKLFNQASQVVLVRDGDRTVLTMVNDFQGSMKEFAIVIPVPTVLKREQIHVGDKAQVDHLDAFSAPRLVEYFDDDPCAPRFLADRAAMPMAAPTAARVAEARSRSLGVTIEAKYTVGEYDILILSAQQSTGLETWLRENGYRIPAGASEVLATYLKQNMRFFVAKVNLTEQTKLGYSYLRPLQMAFESPKFMLPLRLGMVNANGPQDLIVYALTRKGRVETTNYRTVKLPSDMDLPVFLKDRSEFGRFYKAMFARQLEKQGGSVVFTEYAWDTGWCDPCASDPLSGDELRQLGVFWQDSVGPRTMGTYITRLHVRYDAAHFPEDLVFQETADRGNFQGRYVLRHAWRGESSCSAAAGYRSSVRDRQEREAQQLASLTGWQLDGIRTKMGLDKPLPEPAAWWQRIWKN